MNYYLAQLIVAPGEGVEGVELNLLVQAIFEHKARYLVEQYLTDTGLLLLNYELSTLSTYERQMLHRKLITLRPA